jgi:2-methylisocitrate lyase-like PEP mutase family enzyme
MTMARDERLETFRKLHQEGLLVLPNAWDAATARVFEEAGAKAIATTSAGIAAVHGYADGNHLPRALATSAVERIVRSVRVPVTADIEAGYGRTPEEVCETVRGVIGAGAVGINLEDGTGTPELLVSKIDAIRGLAAREGSDLFVNARIDVYLNGAGDTDASFDESLRRAALYAEAGADGIFIPGLLAAERLRAFCAAVPLPVNALAFRGLPAPAELARLGVRRLSVGSSPMRAALTFARRLAVELLEEGSYRGLTEGVMSHAETNALFARE